MPEAGLLQKVKNAPGGDSTAEGLVAGVRAQLNRTVLRGFRLTTLVVAVLFAVFIYLDWISLAAPARNIVPWVDAGLSLFFFALYGVHRSRLARPERAHALGFVVLSVACLNGFLLLRLTGDPVQSLSFMLAHFAAAYLFLSWPWYVGSLVVSGGLWVAGVASFGWTPTWIQWGVAMLASTGVATAAFAVRYTTQVRLETLRSRDEGQKARLEEALTLARSAEESTRLAVDRLVEIDSLRAANRFRAAFMNEVSHELNTPLTPIKIQLALIRAHPALAADAALRASFEILGRNMERLEVLVRQTVAAGQLQAGLSQLRFARLDVKIALEESAHRWMTRFRQHRVDLRLTPSGPVHARADPDRFREVMDALLESALKSTPADGVVTLRCVPHAEGAMVSVKDTGRGVSAAALPFLFQPFPGIENVSGASAAGLSLYVARLLVELQGGTIEATSAGADRGTEISFTLPGMGA